MVSIDYSKAALQARALRQTADGMRSLGSRTHRLTTEIRAAWQGNTAEAYLRKLEAYANRMQNEAARCMKTAEALRSRLEELWALDSEAMRILKSGGEATPAPGPST